MKYNKDERRAINEANRAINEAVKAKEKVEQAQKDRVAREHAARIAREAARLRQERAEEARREAARASRRLSEAERIARAQQDFEARVDAFTAAISEVLKDQDLKLLGGWTKDEWRMVPPTYSGTVVELASTTSEHKAIIRVQIGQGLKR